MVLSSTHFVEYFHTDLGRFCGHELLFIGQREKTTRISCLVYQPTARHCLSSMSSRLIGLPNTIDSSGFVSIFEVGIESTNGHTHLNWVWI